MASAGVAAAGSAGYFTAGSATAILGGAAYVPYVGWALGIAAAVIDTYYIMPALQGKKRDDARSPRLLDSPIGSNVPGAPRVWAIGARIRVPTHVLWQDRKIRQTTANSLKAGTGVQQRKVFFDAVIALNDRPTSSLVNLVGNGKLLLFQSRNFVTISTFRMSVGLVSGRVRLTMLTTLDPDFSLSFAVGDYVFLRNFTGTSGAALNSGYWKVHAVTQHTTTPSTIDLEPRYGQSLAAFSATAGSAFSPASVTREDSRMFVEASTFTVDPSGGYSILFSEDGHAPSAAIALNSTQNLTPVIFENFALDAAYGNANYNGPQTAILESWFSGCGWFTNQPWASNPFGPVPQVNPPIGQTATIRNTAQTGFTPGVFPSGYSLSANFYSGTDTQSANPILVSKLGSGNVPAYRGVAYQVFDEFFATQFGDALPYSMEAILDVDQSMDWGRAIQTIIYDRCDLPRICVDVTGITQRPFLGAYLRGPVPAITVLQPILIAGQLMVQDRDGVLAFTEFANADEVQVENGATFSDFGTRLDGETAGDDKITVEDMATEDLPTKIGVRHQDPDNQYADGYQFFGLRNPEGVDHTNEQEIDLAQMVLTRQEAANLAAVLLRRAWVNRRRYRFTLPASYIHLLESDLLTWTDDDGVQHVGRIIQRDIGSDFRVGIVCIAEDLDLANYVGSPTQSAAGTPPLIIPGPASLDVVIVDAPATREGENRRPGLHLAIGYNGGPWAGAAIYESVDGTTYDLVDVVGKRAVTGQTTTVLGSGTPAEQYGVSTLTTMAQTVEVQFTAYASTYITSRTTKEIVAGANWVALVKPDGTTEIAAFTTATALGNGLFQLSGWLRGLRGTGDVALNTVASCPAGTRVVLLNGDTYYREFAGEISPTAMAYKVVPGGLSLDDVEPILHVNARRNALPLPPRAISKAIDATTFTARFTVTHQWSRAVLPLGTQPPHPMDEPVESYRFTIYDSTGLQVRRVRTITASATGSNTIRDRWIEYTSAEQSADGYTPGPSTLFSVSVEQLGEFGAGPRWFKKF